MCSILKSHCQPKSYIFFYFLAVKIKMARNNTFLFLRKYFYTYASMYNHFCSRQPSWFLILRFLNCRSCFFMNCFDMSLQISRLSKYFVTWITVEILFATMNSLQHFFFSNKRLILNPDPLLQKTFQIRFELWTAYRNAF